MANIDDLLEMRVVPPILLNDKNAPTYEQLKQQLYEDMLEIIGEDDKLFDEDGGMVEGENTARSFKNDLRTTQRQGLAIYFGEPNE
jgi:hypothetical protein